MHEIGRHPTATRARLRSDAIDFALIPGQSKLFLDYQKDPLSLSKYFPSAVGSHVDVGIRAGEVLEAYKVDRNALCNTLETQNQTFSAGSKTFQNIERLRKRNTVTIVTGQQTGLFTGPLYTIYKAVSAIKLAERLSDRGVEAVPVFWAATEDHDFDEISKTVIRSDGRSLDFVLEPTVDVSMSVGQIAIATSFAGGLEQLSAELSHLQFGTETVAQFADIWKPDRTIGAAFCKHLQRLFTRQGLIVVDPLDTELKRLAAPIYVRAIKAGDEIAAALVDRSEELVAKGYHAQVLVTPEHLPLFYHTEDGARRALRRTQPGMYRVSDTKLEYSTEDLVRQATETPERFSPGVMLRPVVQDHLFPTVCYLGGSAEIAYFAQNSVVYRLLERPPTTILHRQSITLLDPKAQRLLKKFGFDLPTIFAGFDALLPDVVERLASPGTAQLFVDAEKDVDQELDRLDHELSRIDPTLAANLATRRRKIRYHLEALRKKFHRVQIERDETLNRQLHWLVDTLAPNGALQERTLNIGGFLARYGESLVDLIVDSVDLDERGHRLIYLQ